MRVQTLKVGEPDKEGQREYLFTVSVNHQPTVYQVRARHEADAQQKLRSYVEADAAQLQELGGAAGAGTLLLVVGAVGAAWWAVKQHIEKKKAAAPVAPAASSKGKRAVINGAEVSAAVDDDEADGSPASSSVNAPFARSFSRSGSIETTASADRTSSERLAAAERAANERAAAERGAAERVAETGQGVRASLQIRPIVYQGVTGTLAGSADPMSAIRVVVFSDDPIDPLLSLVRPGSFDTSSGVLRDGIVVMSFPAAAAKMKASNALEVVVGASSPRNVDVQEATAEAALASVQRLLAGL